MSSLDASNELHICLNSGNINQGFVILSQFFCFSKQRLRDFRFVFFLPLANKAAWFLIRPLVTWSRSILLIPLEELEHAGNLPSLFDVNSKWPTSSLFGFDIKMADFGTLMYLNRILNIWLLGFLSTPVLIQLRLSFFIDKCLLGWYLASGNTWLFLYPIWPNLVTLFPEDLLLLFSSGILHLSALLLAGSSWASQYLCTMGGFWHSCLKMFLNCLDSHHWFLTVFGKSWDFHGFRQFSSDFTSLKICDNFCHRVFEDLWQLLSQGFFFSFCLAVGLLTLSK